MSDDPNDTSYKLTAEVLPDSRTRDRAKGRVGLVQSKQGDQMPIFCPSCGVHGGWCPVTATFAYWLCRKCEATYGHLTGMMVLPDEVQWERWKQEQLDTHGRLLAPEELAQVVAADASALSRLIKAGS